VIRMGRPEPHQIAWRRKSVRDLNWLIAGSYALALLFLAFCVLEICLGHWFAYVWLVVEGRHARVHREPPGPDRWKNRSRTLIGIAEAMADQWSNLNQQRVA
jgi:hypothetical protein